MPNENKFEGMQGRNIVYHTAGVGALVSILTHSDFAGMIASAAETKQMLNRLLPGGTLDAIDDLTHEQVAKIVAKWFRQLAEYLENS